jgi:methylglutaconyl-CoA hydratase
MFAEDKINDKGGTFKIKYLCNMQWVQLEVSNRVATVVMSRIDKRNAFNPELVAELFEIIQSLNQRDDVKIILIKSAAAAFSAGADLSYIQKLGGFTHEENVADSRNLKNLFEAIYQSPKITITQVEGPALAGGCGLASISDFCFATPESTFGYTEARIGFVPALVMVYLRHKLPMNTCNEWLLTAGVFSANKAFEDGLIYKVSENIEVEVNAFMDNLLKGVSLESVSRTKMMLRNLPYNHEEALEFAAQQNALARKTEDCVKGIDHFLRKEKLEW